MMEVLGECDSKIIGLEAKKRLRIHHIEGVMDTCFFFDVLLTVHLSIYISVIIFKHLSQ